VADQVGEQFLQRRQPPAAEEAGVLRLDFRDYLQRVAHQRMPFGGPPDQDGSAVGRVGLPAHVALLGQERELLAGGLAGHAAAPRQRGDRGVGGIEVGEQRRVGIGHVLIAALPEPAQRLSHLGL
jgi:hypothetical protein